MYRLSNFIFKHQDLFTFLGLSLLFYFIFFHNIWAYALMDVDESRYVSMAKDMFNSKDFLTLYLNKEYFFEKPPLFFWSECLSFAIFGKINEFTARFPVAMYGTLTCFITYFIGKKVVSRTYGIVSSLILATSMEFIILAKFAILDIVVSACIWFSLCFGMLTLFCKETNKKYFWWLFYIFSGFAVLAKGIPGFVIPFGSMFFIYVFEKKFKELFKPQYFIIGFLLFFLVTLPWHIIMLKMYDPHFFNEYIIKHHVSRFLGSEVLRRQQPFYFYIITLIWGFIPWIFSCLTVLIRKISKRDYNKDLTNVRRFLLYNGIIALFILLFFSSSKTKLITYILPIYPALACLGGYIWTNYVEKGEYSRIINRTVYTVGAIVILASIVAIFTSLYLPLQLQLDIASIREFCILLLFSTGLASILFAKKRLYYGVFFTYVVFMLMLSAFGTEKMFEIDYKFGQDDLLEYAEYAKKNNKSIMAYGFSHKYCLLYYGENPVEFGLDLKMKDLKKAIKSDSKVIIIPYKVLTEEIKNLNYKTLDKGRKYILIE